MRKFFWFVLQHLSAYRLALSVVGVLGAVYLSWWIPLIVMILLAFRTPAWEVPALGLLIDFLWLPGSFLSSLPFFTLAGLLLVWGLEPLRKELFV